jgi:hypothetical protein
MISLQKENVKLSQKWKNIENNNKSSKKKM